MFPSGKIFIFQYFFERILKKFSLRDKAIDFIDRLFPTKYCP